MARSANGDAFAVWQADDGTRRNLWANRYRALSAAWGNPVNIEASTVDIDEFDISVDAHGNAVVAWHEAPNDLVMSARFDAAASAWAMPVLLANIASEPRVAADATGAMLVVYGGGARGRFFDPVSGAWQPEAAIEQSSFSTGASFGPVPLMDGSGNALVAYQNARIGVGILASNYFSRATGSWGQLPPGSIDEILGEVPGSFLFGFNENLQLAASGNGNFLLLWQATFDNGGANPATFEIRMSRFTTSTRTWSNTQTVVPVGADVRFQRLGSDGSGNALLLWTANEGTRTALKATRIDPAGAISGAVRVIDSAVSGGAARADLGVDTLGNAIVIWQQFEGGRPDDGSRGNIAVNRFDATAHTWATAELAEAQPGNATSPRASVSQGQALLGWIQSESGTNRVKALLRPIVPAPAR